MYYLEINADYKKYLDFLVFFIAPVILFLKSNDDRKFKFLSFRTTKLAIFIINLSPILYIATLILSFSNLLNQNLVDDFIINFCMSTAVTISIFKRKYKLFNSIEEIYEAILELTIIFYIFNIQSSLIIASTLILTSISAGISKLKSKIWVQDKYGMIMFLLLPSITRKKIRTTTTNLLRKFRVVKSLLMFSSLLVPIIQISSGVGLLIIPLFGNNIFSFLSLFLQLSFTLLLFIISDLSWITAMYCWLIIFFFISVQHLLNSGQFFLNPSNLFILLSLFFMFLCLKQLFFSRLLNNIYPLKTFISKLTFEIVPFKMFTEAHMVNIITFYIKDSNKLNKPNLNAFNSSGKRSNSQNLTSRHCQAMMYPLGDFLNICHLAKINTLQIENNDIYKSKLHQKQCLNFFKLIKNNEVIFFQHHFSKQTFEYKTAKVAILKVNKDKSFDIKNLNPMYTLER